MELDSISQTYQIAEEDITCYKHMLACPNGEYRSCYHKHTWEPNVIYTSPLIKKWTSVDEGFHSYKTLKDAEDDWDKFMFVGTALVKCVIPKGACYYTGKYGLDTDVYASDKLKMVQLIKIKGDFVNDSPFPYKMGDKVEIKSIERVNVRFIDTIFAIFKYQCQYHMWFCKAGLGFLTLDENGMPIQQHRKDLKIIKIKGE